MNQTKTPIVPIVPRDKKKSEFLATGKRKTSIARVSLHSGEGKIIVNGLEVAQYFPRPTLQMMINRPFEVTGTAGKFDIIARVFGGGIAGQAGAVKHGISKALLSMNPDLRKPLKTDGLLTRDDRIKERRKVGCRKARRRPQYSKR